MCAVVSGMMEVARLCAEGIDVMWVAVVGCCLYLHGVMWVAVVVCGVVCVLKCAALEARYMCFPWITCSHI